MDSKSRPRVVVVGAGFGGLTAAQRLAHLPVQITVVDRKNHHTFQPLLYQVATAGLSPGEIAAPIRWILRAHSNIEVLLEEVREFNLNSRSVITNEAVLPYDYLVIAAGASHAYFGHPEWEPLAPGLKTIEDALEIRRRVLLAFELAERQALNGASDFPLNFVVVGAGPAGVELAGTLAEISRHVLANEFRAINPARTRILLLEGGPRVLPAYSEDLSRKAQEQLKHNQAKARRAYQPTSQRYLLRTLVRCGQCQLHMQAARQLSVCKRYEYLYYCCAGKDPVTVGRVERCPSRRVRADRLDVLVWTLVRELLQDPQVILQEYALWQHVQYGQQGQFQDQ